MKKSKGALILVLMLVIMAGMGWYAVSIVTATESGGENGIKLGLDLAGGVSITYQTVMDNPSEEDMNDTIYKLQKRVDTYSTEAQVYQEGDNRINIDIPLKRTVGEDGSSQLDANEILEELGKPGSLEFQTEDGTVVLTGADVVDAQPASQNDQITGQRSYMVALTLSDTAAETFAQVTTEHIGERLPIVYDGEVIRDPVIRVAITDGNAVIDGMSSWEDAEELASQIRIGSLSLELEELHSKVVGAQLGEDALATSLQAAAIGIILIMVFMVIMYLVPGLASALALVIYCGLTIAVLQLFEITLTLPGIAGIILSIGMAVDANVIIFARIREEIAAGKTVESAMKTGFQKATSAIVDGNITTLIAAIVLGLRGSGSVKGFAYTLGIGIVVSMFTALVITRWILKSFYALGLKDAKLYGTQKERKVGNFLGKRGICFAISIVLIAAGFVGMGIHNSSNGTVLNYSLDFVGGSANTVEFNKDYSIDEINDTILPVVMEVTGDSNVQAQKVEGSMSVVIKTRTLNLEEREAFNTAMAENFQVEESGITSENISSVVSSEMKADAVWAVIIATICMLIYIWFRFKDIRFAGSAVIALIHDVLIVLAFYVVSWVSVGNTFIACMLTIVGYSINATIVIFDRIRENSVGLRNQEPDTLKEMVNRSITQTLSRSINTSLTTFVMVFVLWLLGVAAIREFALPLMVGIICGAYSSVCITGALWYVFKVKLPGKKKA